MNDALDLLHLTVWSSKYSKGYYLRLWLLFTIITLTSSTPSTNSVVKISSKLDSSKELVAL